MKSALIVICNNILIEQHKIRLPHFIWWKSQHGNSAVVNWVPLQLKVRPVLKAKLIVRFELQREKHGAAERKKWIPYQIDPHVGHHDLVLLILQARQM